MRPRELTSLGNPRLKQVRKLRSRRYREKERLLLVEGPRVLATALDLGAGVEDVFVTDAFWERSGELAARLAASPLHVWVVDDAAMATLAATENCQGVVATARTPGLLSDTAVCSDFLGVALDGIGDPGNVGTIVRAAHGAGAAAVLLGPGCCDPFNPKAVRASAGGVFAVPFLAAESLAGTLRLLRSRGAAVFVAEAGAGVPYWSMDLRVPTVLVVGSEAHGLSESVRDVADGCVCIPMPGGAESLNAGAALTVLLWEAVRQRCGAGLGEEEGR